ncbi:MAG: DUF4132 domain-containing protein [Lachnospiraceae bacterium]|nr:DUF4132 domain-containing protein [Lachnospiraceae bacterium]
MADYDYNTRQKITKGRSEELYRRIGKFAASDKDLALELKEKENTAHKMFQDISRQFYARKDARPSRWFTQGGAHQGLLDAFVPKRYQPSYLYIIDKLNQFPFTRGWARRPVRTAGYGPQAGQMFSLLLTFEKFFYLGDRPEDLILKRLDGEKLDYVQNQWYFGRDFSYVYAAEIDLGNQTVVQALKDLILSENNTAYLDREMILGIMRSDNEELHELMCKLLLAARLQEGVRQAVCEAMDEGVCVVFEKLLRVIEDNGLIRFSAVKRAVSTWIGIFDENSVDRVNEKLLGLMGRCLRDEGFCRAQLATNDSVAISAALWALGFREAEDAIQAMDELIGHGTKNQKLTASFYNQSLYDPDLKIRMAQKVIWEHTEDMELVAAFMPAFTTKLYSHIQYALSKDGRGYYWEFQKPRVPVLADYYGSREEAEALYEKFMGIYQRLPKKGVVYSPCIFPWHQVELSPSIVVAQMAFLAYVLQDEEKITYIAGLLGNVGSGRARLVNLLLYQPSNQEQRNLVIGLMGNAEAQASDTAVKIVKNLTLNQGEYRLLEDMLRFKRSSLRGILISMLMGQPKETMKDSVRRLLTDKKEEKRSAGLDMLMRLSKDEGKAGLYKDMKPMAALVENPTDKEKILIQEILEGQKESAADKKGFGIYDPDAPEEAPKATGLMTAKQLSALCLPFTEEEAVEKLKKLDQLVNRHKDYEYLAENGDKVLLGNSYRKQKRGKEEKAGEESPLLEQYPLAGELRKFYEGEIGSIYGLIQIAAVDSRTGQPAYQAAKGFYQEVFGFLPFKPEPFRLEYTNQVRDIRLVYHREFLDRKKLLETGVNVVSALTPYVNSKNITVSYPWEGWNGRVSQIQKRFCEMPLFFWYFKGLKYWETDEEFTRAFHAAWRYELACQADRKRRRFMPDNGAAPQTPIRPYWFFKACHMGLVSEDILYKALMEYFDRKRCLEILCKVKKRECVKPMNGKSMADFFGDQIADQIYKAGEAYFEENHWLAESIGQAYDRIVPAMVDVELRRGEQETSFSWDMQGITYIQGTGYLIRILMALGKDTLGKETYYSWYYGGGNLAKKEVLSGLLKACYPAEGETGEDLRKALKGSKVKEARLVEVAMYAPQWIDVIQEYLGWAGLKSGCYYFMAHMNERFDDQKKAIIAKYTPLTPDELQAGAFDAAWFEEAYGMLGEKNFGMLYQAAKYISDGQKHSRARKYADAAAGKVTLEELRTEILSKRNKDLLMSYGLVPFGESKEKEVQERYQFIQQYRKESRQFGAQRRASEGKAADIALVNLSVRAGFADVTRLTLNVEGRLAESFAAYMQWAPVGDVEVCLSVGEDGKSAVLCRKGQKELKSIPSKLAKDPYVLQVKEAHKKLKEQYSRTRKMMEESMESGELFTASEVEGLLANPVVRAILEPLVFVAGEKMGFVRYSRGPGDEALAGLCLEAPAKGGDVSAPAGEEGKGTAAGAKEAAALPPEEKLRIAHPLDLYRDGRWHEYQKYLFSRGIRQPFKQVFRELYVKLPEESGLKASRMFAGNQIQPRKAVACLRDRRWVADYEEGLQKIYYKEDIIARIYALADWFSPSDIEEPTLEWVEFFDRKTFQALTIGQVPDRIYSEVMRDVDLAVSVAHAGGVDPETSHSTIEMRRAIVELNLPMFGIRNVVLKDSHALVQGSRAAYNVHLGSGVVHQEGGAMLNILPVHSQKRGKLFLPFVDEDPKTAEIMSKIVLLAEDKKIKDPFILEQIRV